MALFFGHNDINQTMISLYKNHDNRAYFVKKFQTKIRDLTDVEITKNSMAMNITKAQTIDYMQSNMIVSTDESVSHNITVTKNDGHNDVPLR